MNLSRLLRERQEAGKPVTVAVSTAVSPKQMDWSGPALTVAEATVTVVVAVLVHCPEVAVRV